MIYSCPKCGGLRASENFEMFAGTPCKCGFEEPKMVASPSVGSHDWLSGIGVLGWKRVMSRELFESEDAARKWAESHGLKDVEYIPASMPKMPDNVRVSHSGPSAGTVKHNEET